MSRRVAFFISVILHPVLMPTYTLYFLLHHNTYFDYTTQPREKLALYLIIVINTLILPVMISYALLKRGLIRSFELEVREERLIPFISNAIFMMVAYYLMRKLMLPKVFQLLILGATASVVIAVIINLKWKISIHMIGIGGIVGTFFGLSTFMLIDVRFLILFHLIIAGLLGTARLKLQAHMPMQIYAGFLVGFFCEYLILSI